MLKTDLHTHAGTDEHHKLDHTPKQLINKAHELNYKVLSITNHNTITYSKELANYAKKKGILLIPGAELFIHRKEVIVLNITKKLKSKIKKFYDLEKYKDENILVIAPHPFYPDPKSLQSKLEKHIKLFDAIEFSHFYLSWITFNTKAQQIARKYKLSLLGTSDCHLMEQFGTTYSSINAEQNIDSVFEALRKRKVRLVTKPLPTLKAMKFMAKIYLLY